LDGGLWERFLTAIKIFNRLSGCIKLVEDNMRDESLGDCFSESFSARKEKPAITFLRDGRVETELSYLELERDINRMASVFQNLGIEKGDRVIFLIPKSLILVVAHLALQKIGALSVPLNPGFKKSELEYLLNDAQPKIILSEPGMEALIREIDPGVTNLIIDTQKPYHDIEVLSKASEEFRPVEVNPYDPALIIYTTAGRKRRHVRDRHEFFQPVEWSKKAGIHRPPPAGTGSSNG